MYLLERMPEPLPLALESVLLSLNTAEREEVLLVKSFHFLFSEGKVKNCFEAFGDHTDLGGMKQIHVQRPGTFALLYISQFDLAPTSPPTLAHKPGR